MQVDRAADEERQAILAAYRNSPATPQLTWPLTQALKAAWPSTLSELASDQLLADLLLTAPLYPLWIERRLTDIRRDLLFRGCEPGVEPLLANLAIQCHLNDYAWQIGSDEADAVADLSGRLGQLSPVEAMTLACYRPLHQLPGSEVLLARGWSGAVEAVLDDQIAAARREAALQGRIPSLTPIGEGVSTDVRAQYEANPYPRWRRVTRMPTTTSVFGWRVPARPNVLYAGCGTGQHAIHAGQRFADARILGVDLSRASLGYALRKTREAGIGNIGYAQADLLTLASTNLTFDIVECSGVIHHMADPFEGLRALTGRLRPGGLIKIGVYSATARRRLAAAKALARNHTPETIRDLRQAIASAPEGDPLREPMRYSDFFSTSACRDLLMHVQEHEMDVSDIRRMLGENGLRFLGFAVGGGVLDAYRAASPHDPTGVDLDGWEAFEAEHPETFRNMYQFWAVKAG